MLPKSRFTPEQQAELLKKQAEIHEKYGANVGRTALIMMVTMQVPGTNKEIAASFRAAADISEMIHDAAAEAGTKDGSDGFLCLLPENPKLTH